MPSTAVVASLRVAEDLDKFDPRGMLFRPDGSLLISDGSDPVILVTAQDFRLGRSANVAEPSILWLFAIACAGLLVVAARQRVCFRARRCRHIALHLPA